MEQRKYYTGSAELVSVFDTAAENIAKEGKVALAELLAKISEHISITLALIKSGMQNTEPVANDATISFVLTEFERSLRFSTVTKLETAISEIREKQLVFDVENATEKLNELSALKQKSVEREYALLVKGSLDCMLSQFVGEHQGSAVGEEWLKGKSDSEIVALRRAYCVDTFCAKPTALTGLAIADVYKLKLPTVINQLQLSDYFKKDKNTEEGTVSTEV